MDQSNQKRTKAKISSHKFDRMQWDPGLRERKTMTDYLAASLRTAIYDGQFADDEELNQVELAEFFGVSRVPIREALRQLQAEGLVQNIAHHRTVVAGLTLPQILEALEMRAVVESHLLRKAALNFEKIDLDRLRKISRWVVKNWEFHRALYGRSSSQTMIDAVERIQLNVERYARRAGTTERLRQAAAEHWQIVKAIERKDFTKAADLLERHIVHTGEEIRRAREKVGSLPSGKLRNKDRKRPAIRK